MSLGEAQRFYKKIRHDADFFHLFVKALESIPNDYRDQAIYTFAREQGFDVSLEDLKHNLPKARLSVNKLGFQFKPGQNQAPVAQSCIMS